MHILIIHQAFASLNEPGGTRHFEFARLLASRGHQVTVIASPVSYLTGGQTRREAEQVNGVRILRAEVYQAHHKSFFHRLLAFFSFMLSSFWIGLGVRRVDVVWGTSPPIFQGVTAWLLARVKGAKFLFEVRDLWPQFAIAVGVLKNPRLIAMSEWLERFLYRRADRVMVNSPGFIEHVQARGAKRAVLIPNGADPAMFDPNQNGAAFRESNGLKDKFVALYAGAHGLSNDLIVVLECARLLENTNVQIVLLGDGKEKPALQAAAKRLNLFNVTFLPPVPKHKMAEALAGADACIAILKPIEAYKTTYPNKVFDYMAAGKPVILAIDGVIREVVQTAHCGLYTQPGNALEMARALRILRDNPEYGREMGLLGRKYLEQNFSRTALGEKLLEMLGELSENFNEIAS
ncbi:MAG: glycosyltransferase family 4 protein [Anaerolineales bacterium]|nr:glycosyltransferase family 4 protein [Anaerolineales bacterium]